MRSLRPFCRLVEATRTSSWNGERTAEIIGAIRADLLAGRLTNEAPESILARISARVADRPLNTTHQTPETPNAR